MNDNENKTNAPIKLPVRWAKSDGLICDANDRVICEFNGEHSTGYGEGVCAMAIVSALNEADALRAKVEGMREFIESMEIAHFTHNGKPAVIYKDDDTYTLLAQAGGDSKGHTHVWDAYAAIKPNAAAGGEGTE